MPVRPHYPARWRPSMPPAIPISAAHCRRAPRSSARSKHRRRICPALWQHRAQRDGAIRRRWAHLPRGGADADRVCVRHRRQSQPGGRRAAGSALGNSRFRCSALSRQRALPGCCDHRSGSRSGWPAAGPATRRARVRAGLDRCNDWSRKTQNSPPSTLTPPDGTLNQPCLIWTGRTIVGGASTIFDDTWSPIWSLSWSSKHLPSLPGWARRVVKPAAENLAHHRR